jgi:glutamate/tyrosine decarboxylase-like PLP-dependent enzyme
MNVTSLAERFDLDQREGRRPFAIVATAGTTGTGAIDPLPDIASICEEHRLWMHVDACYGGAALLLDELKSQFAGIERADSIALDPHKWFFAPLTTSLIMVKDPEIEHRCFDIKASYIPHQEGTDAYRRGLPTSRRASSLTLWMSLRAHGWNAVRDAVRGNIRLSRLLEKELEQAGFRVVPGGELSIACARFEPDGWTGEAIDKLQADITGELIASGETWFATTQHDGKIWMRFNTLNIYTRGKHIRKLVGLLVDAANRLRR